MSCTILLQSMFRRKSRNTRKDGLLTERMQAIWSVAECCPFASKLSLAWGSRWVVGMVRRFRGCGRTWAVWANWQRRSIGQSLWEALWRPRQTGSKTRSRHRLGLSKCALCCPPWRSWAQSRHSKRCPRATPATEGSPWRASRVNGAPWQGAWWPMCTTSWATPACSVS